MFVIPEIRKLNEFIVVETISRKKAFHKGLGVDYRYKSSANFSNAIEQRKQSKIESFDMGETILTDDVIKLHIEQQKAEQQKAEQQKAAQVNESPSKSVQPTEE